ncbi:hypothetical protein LIER_42215 [Lithospermum erythrorhizon]|uniref:Reverse transcriptase domain-containing protein n=1 Tax=Lithospermum erythrorhizon TaxID=34254 RepID=A0AAV3RRW5_LITER
MKKLKGRLKQLNTDEFSNISTKLIEKNHELVAVQAEVLNGNLDRVLLSKARSLEKEFAMLSKAERLLFRSKSRATWAKKGDSSTSYFHSCMQMYHIKSRITMIKGVDGCTTSEADEIQKTATDFYKTLFTDSSNEIMELPSDAIVHRVKEEDKVWLTTSIREYEIENVVVSMKKDKAPGPDGYSVEFYKDTWPIIKASVCAAVKICFCTGIMPKYINSTTLSLIPEVKNLVDMKQFRSIACCNTVYKIVSTIVAGRLKRVLNGIIGVQQSAYVPGRRITYGILVMQKLMLA